MEFDAYKNGKDSYSFGDVSSAYKNSGGDIGSAYKQGEDYQHKDWTDNYKTEQRQEDRKDPNAMPYPFSLVLFGKLSDKMGIYYARYIEFASRLEQLFKERVVNNNSPITAITKAKTGEFIFTPLNVYVGRAIGIGFVCVLITMIAAMLSFAPIISLPLMGIVLFIVIASMHYDLMVAAEKYTYASRKYAADDYPETVQFYLNIIAAFNRTEAVYCGIVLALPTSLLLALLLQGLIEYAFIYESGMGGFTYVTMLSLTTLPITYYIYYKIATKRIMNQADIDRENLIDDILASQKTNFDVARDNLKKYKS